MTVNELIAELQVLSAQGHGELDVVATEVGDCGSDTTILSLDLLTVEDAHHNGYYYRLLSNWETAEGWDKTEAVRGKPYIYLQASFHPS
tara:strand:+ start:2678 stop:2944 length:267 start_codon:yes stop_codon:yes gene_type:complete